CGGPAPCEHPFGKAGKMFAIAGLPVPAMDEDQARSRWISAWKDIPFIPLARAIGEIEVLRPLCAQGRRGGDPALDHLCAATDGCPTIVRRIARLTCHRAPVVCHGSLCTSEMRRDNRCDRGSHEGTTMDKSHDASPP